jgi:hypothetical protein
LFRCLRARTRRRTRAKGKWLEWLGVLRILWQAQASMKAARRVELPGSIPKQPEPRLVQPRAGWLRFLEPT